jgi:hypothetical protein
MPVALSPGRRQSGLFKKSPRKITFAVPLSFFKSISMIFGGAGLIFEG